jgi:hypothetical protein
MRRLVIPFAALALSITHTPIKAMAQAVRPGGTLRFATRVPAPPVALPVLRLTPQAVPVELMNRLLASTAGGGKLEPLATTPFFQKNNIKVSEQVIGVVEDEHVRAWADERTGAAQIYPTLSELKPVSPSDAKDLASRTRAIFESPEFIAHDDTRFVIADPQILNGATLVRDRSGNTRAEKAQAPYLVYVSARRIVAGLPVDGPGSRAMLAVGQGGSVAGLTRVWKSAKTAEMVRSSLSADQVRNQIARQLVPASRNSDVVVDSIELAYYDGNHEFLQPVYRFTARIRERIPRGKPPTADDFLIGYVPFAKTFEPLPSLAATEGPKPGVAAPNPKPPGHASSGSTNDPILGRYVVRNDDAGWVNDANAFWSSVSSTWTAPLFTNSQYYWAEPRLFTNEKDSFINAMNLALIEVHGDWWLYSTLRNCCDLVNINGGIPSPGYGPSANGRLADWIIHSCEVVPAPDDTASWPTPWWNIFGGVRNVVGYRTIMYISDGAGGPYGTSLGNLAPVVSSWLNDVISLNAYSGHPKAAAHGNVSRPMGRPSTISMCGHDGDSVLSMSSLGRANCLTVWWFPD